MSNKQIITLDEWANQFSQDVAAEIYRTLDGIEKEKRGKLHTKLPLAFLSRFIALTTYKVLTERPSTVKTKKEAYEYTMKAFNAYKISLQNTIAQGFQGAMTEFSGKELDYMCTIKLVPEPINTKPC